VLVPSPLTLNFGTVPLTVKVGEGQTDDPVPTSLFRASPLSVGGGALATANPNPEQKTTPEPTATSSRRLQVTRIPTSLCSGSLPWPQHMSRCAPEPNASDRGGLSAPLLTYC